MQRISCDKSLQPSIPKTNGEGLPRRYVCSAGEHLHHIFPTVIFKLFVHSVTSESKETTVVGHDVKNAGGATKFKIKVHIHLCNVISILSAFIFRTLEKTLVI